MKLMLCLSQKWFGFTKKVGQSEAPKFFPTISEFEKVILVFSDKYLQRSSSGVERWTHNPEAVGAIPSSATNKEIL
jgi:hypothetical protein